MSSTSAPVNPFLIGTRGFGCASTPRLVRRLAEYRLLRARVETESRTVWPAPETAALYVEAVLAELEAELAGREAGLAA